MPMLYLMRMKRALQNNTFEKNQILLKKRALYYLGKREYSRRELQQKIESFADNLDISRQQMDKVLSELVDKDWLSDTRFTDQFIFSKKKKYGFEKIRYELKMRGVDEAIVNESLNEIKSEEYNLAKNIWEKKFRKLPEDYEKKLKQMRFLKGRGINSALINQILSGKVPE